MNLTPRTSTDVFLHVRGSGGSASVGATCGPTGSVVPVWSPDGPHAWARSLTTRSTLAGAARVGPGQLPQCASISFEGGPAISNSQTDAETSADKRRRKTKVFISHSSFDYPLARQVAEIIEGAGLEVVGFEKASAGSAWASAVVGAMDQADAVLVLVSKAYVASNSAVISSEITAAMASGKRIVPVILEEGATPPAIIAPYLGVDLSDRRSMLEKLQVLGKQIENAVEAPVGASELADIETLRTETQKLAALKESNSTKSLELAIARQKNVRIALVLTFVTVFTITIVVTLAGGSLMQLLLGAFPAVLGIVGTAVGFYFGQDRRS